MQLFLFGATGPTGQLVLADLIQQGYQVTALVRTPEMFDAPQSPLFRLLKGNVMQPDTYQNALIDVDVVVSILGTGTSTKPTTIYSAGGTAILNAMRQAGVKRLITVTSGGVQEDDPVIQRSFFYKYIGLWWLRHVYADMKRWETILDRTEDIDWTCIRPTYLVKGYKTENYRVQELYAPDKGWKISRADLANFIIRQINDSTFIHKKPVIAY